MGKFISQMITIFRSWHTGMNHASCLALFSSNFVLKQKQCFLKQKYKSFKIRHCCPFTRWWSFDDWQLKWDSFHCVGYWLYYCIPVRWYRAINCPTANRDVLILSSSSKISVIFIIEMPEDFNDTIRFLTNWESFPIAICVNTRSCLIRVTQFNKKDSISDRARDVRTERLG